MTPVRSWALAVGQRLQLTINGAPHQALVEEVTTGTLESVIGSPVCPLNIGETMTYVELRLTDPAGVTSRLTIDSHRFRDLLAYRKTTLSSAQQKQLFGRVLCSSRPVGGGTGRNIGCAIVAAIVSIVLAVGLFSACSSSSRSRGGADSTSTSDSSSSRTYRHRPVYGGGGGGVGK